MSFIRPSILLPNFLVISSILLKILNLSLTNAFIGIFWTFLHFDAQYFIRIGQNYKQCLTPYRGVFLKKASVKSRCVTFLFLVGVRLRWHKFSKNSQVLNYSQNVISNMVFILCILWRNGVIFITFLQPFWT